MLLSLGIAVANGEVLDEERTKGGERKYEERLVVDGDSDGDGNGIGCNILM